MHISLGSRMNEGFVPSITPDTEVFPIKPIVIKLYDIEEITSLYFHNIDLRNNINYITVEALWKYIIT